jgi:hypothetical protein
VRQAKAHANYTPAIGEALGIEGPEQSGPDFATLKPVLKLRLQGGQVMVGWGWEGESAFLHIIEIHATGDAVETFYAGQGCTGESPKEQAAQRGIELVVVKLAEARRGFVLLPKRWVVERSHSASLRAGSSPGPPAFDDWPGTMNASHKPSLVSIGWPVSP